ncbi:multidrug DMT transporter permease [Aquirufa nivalisilvae]|uniref:GRP family sugar transporter n=1 Tax=Aquirufa nivalisilvae TaxID=2516557 RepID=UPI0022A93781|nr:GRP family sugar transporter [Aquirufa nivalisilvae]MCZ2481427.1 multidrug DMT transporter permease [Aquirufa nivalisilvae]
MFIIENYLTAVLLCIVTMLCWGSWANTQKLTSSHWRFELFYWDYALGILISAILFALTLGSVGDEGRSFIPDLNQATQENLFSAFLGGVIFNGANILLVAAISIAGMSVAFPVGIGIALVLGVLVNYLAAPQGSPILIFGGVALISLAIILNARAYKQLNEGGSEKLSSKGLFLSVISGCLMGLFYKYVAASMATNFVAPEVGKLSPYTALVLFSLGVLLSSFLFNTWQMKKPFSGNAVSFGDYFQGTFQDHIMGILGGGIWFIGMALSILASEKAGPAVSYGLGQGATVVAAIWGIFIWKEFDKAKSSTKSMLNWMLFLYIVGLALLIGAK